MRVFSRSTVGVSAVVLTFGLAGCSSAPTASSARGSQVMVPTASSPEGIAAATGENKGDNAGKAANTAIYNVPVPADPKGQVRLLGLGFVKLGRSTKELLPALHLQMTVANQTGGSTWSVDARLQTVRLDDAQSLRPSIVRLSEKAERKNLPFIAIQPGKTRVIDLFYVLPKDRRKAGDVQKVTLDWQVVTGTKSVEDKTSFESLSKNFAPFLLSSASAEGRMKSATPSLSGATMPTAASGADPAQSQDVADPVDQERDWWLDPFAELPSAWRAPL